MIFRDKGLSPPHLARRPRDWEPRLPAQQAPSRLVVGPPAGYLTSEPLLAHLKNRSGDLLDLGGCWGASAKFSGQWLAPSGSV